VSNTTKKTGDELNSCATTGTRKYTCNSNIYICIFDLLQKYVRFDLVGNVIRSVLNLVNIKIENNRVK